MTKQLEKGKKYDLDYDNQIIEHEKWDAKPTYKHTTGYFAGIARYAIGMETSSDIRDEEYCIPDYDGHNEKLLQLLYQKGIGGIQRYSTDIKNEMVYFQIHLCCR